MGSGKASPEQQPAAIDSTALIATVLQSSDLNPEGYLRMHLLRFITLDAPKPAMATMGGSFKALSELRSGNMADLQLLRGRASGSNEFDHLLAEFRRIRRSYVGHLPLPEHKE